MTLRTDRPEGADLLEEAAQVPGGEERRQEYVLHRLEGLSPSEAVAAVPLSLDSLHPHNPQRGPLGGPRNHLGNQTQRPLVSDYLFEGAEHFVSFTADTRTEDDIERQDENAAFLWELLSTLTEEERAAIVRVYGIGFEAVSYADAADLLGWPLSKVRLRVKSGLRNLRKVAA